jgi:hypothetical protein
MMVYFFICIKELKEKILRKKIKIAKIINIESSGSLI